jgi:shikimate kinase
MSVAELFRQHGEADFREMEARLTAALCSLPEIVVAPGAGWAALPGALEGLPADTTVVWLRIEPEEALRRLGHATEERPLLAGTDPLSALAGLAERRTQHYDKADLVIDVGGRAVDEIARTIVEWLKRSTS